jgi:hypothetical protein
MSTLTVLDELTQDDLAPEYVDQRVSDWVQRINDLYDTIEKWLPAGWRSQPGQPLLMDEGLMRSANIAPREVPTLELVRDDAVHISFRPHGLWIVGTNGRVDIVKKNQLFFLLDNANSLEPANWQFASAEARREVKPFDQHQLLSILE